MAISKKIFIFASAVLLATAILSHRVALAAIEDGPTIDEFIVSLNADQTALSVYAKGQKGFFSSDTECDGRECVPDIAKLLTISNSSGESMYSRNEWTPESGLQVWYYLNPFTPDIIDVSSWPSDTYIATIHVDSGARARDPEWGKESAEETKTFTISRGGTIFVNSMDSATRQPLYGSWYFPSGPVDPCSGLQSCSGTSGSYTNMPADQLYTFTAPYSGEQPPSGYAFGYAEGSCGASSEIPACILLTGGELTFNAYWDPLATISTSQMSLSFEAVQRSSSPSPQTIVVSNTGTSGSSLNWSAISDRSWLSVSPSSGSGLLVGSSQNVSVSVNIAGLDPGEHTGTITVSGVSNPGGHSVAPRTIAVTFVVHPAASCSFTGKPLVIALFGTSELSWSCQEAEECSINQGIGSVNPASGSKEVSPDETTTYTLFCLNEWSETNLRVTIEVVTTTRREVPP